MDWWMVHQYLIRLPHGRLPLEVGRRHQGRLRSHLAWEHLRIPEEELENVAGEKEVWNSLINLLPP